MSAPANASQADQTDVLAENDRLKTELAAANERAAIAEKAMGDAKTALETLRGELKASEESRKGMAGELATAQKRVADLEAENKALKSVDADANARAAKIVAAAGITGTPRPAAATSTGKPPTLTERALAAIAQKNRSAAAAILAAAN